MRKLEYILRRFFLSLGVLIGITVITFALTHVIPSNPAALYLGPRARADDIARISDELGFNKPLVEQYVIYMQHLAQGDLGTSIATKRPVFQELADRLPATLELLAVATLLSIIIGIPLGVISARLQGEPLDAGVRTTSIIGVSLPPSG